MLAKEVLPSPSRTVATRLWLFAEKNAFDLIVTDIRMPRWTVSNF
jgi:CheY-like chemotaxis protein